MVKGGKRGGRVRDKWRDKQWVIVRSPSAFGENYLNYLPVTIAEGAKGRVIESTMFDILKQDPTQHQTKVFVQIESISEGVAKTIFKGHEYAKEFLRSLIRRGSSMINHVHDYTTLDGFTFRVVLIALTQKRVNSSKKHEIRMLAHKVLEEKIPKLNLDQFVQEATMGKMSADLSAGAKKIAPLRHIGVKKTKLISGPKPTIGTTVESVRELESTSAGQSDEETT